MNFDSLLAISPVDGRYRNKIEELAPYFSEYGLIKYRILVEIEYFIALCRYPLPQLKDFNKNLFSQLRDIYNHFSEKDARKIKDFEEKTNHDVKAVEYFIREKFSELSIDQYCEFIHFGLTSQDINNTATPYLYKDAINNVYLPYITRLIDKLINLSGEWKDIPMLARTHGQPASPTRMGKEIAVFTERLNVQISIFKQIPYSAKFGSATGNFNAQHVAYPQIDWIQFGNTFVNQILGLSRSQTTTQIEHYDNFAASFDCLKRINTILIDFCQDIWAYISREYFKQKIKEGEVGSSTMPHKVNPIDFENAEGNLGIANGFFEFLSRKLPVSRLQRDLTDSTVLRNIGVPIAHTLIALKSIDKGLDKLIINKDIIDKDLEDNISVVAEGIQTILRREGYSEPFEALKKLTRTNRKITKEVINNFIDSLDVSNEVKKELKNITPENYTGI